MDENFTFINILTISLNEKFCLNVASLLADKLDMFVADCHQMIVYDLIDPKQVIEKCGLEYMKKREKSVVKHCGEFCNTVISINFDLYKEYSALFQNSMVVYIKVPQERATSVSNKIDYDYRDKLLQSLAHITVSVDKCLAKQSVKKIMTKLGDFYEDR